MDAGNEFEYISQNLKEADVALFEDAINGSTTMHL
jgi:hypothetical protein